MNDEKQLKFLQQLVEGNTSLFRLPNNKEYAYWVEDKDGNVYALSNVKLESKRDGKKYIRYTNTYKGILKNVFRDQPDLFNEIDKLKYSDIALINLFQKYHELTNQPLKVNFTKRRDVALAWGIIAGLQYSSIKFTGTEELESYLSPTFSNSSNFSFGFFTEAQPVESRHSAYKIAFQYQSAFYSNPTLSLSTNILRVTPAYKYLILPNGKFKPYISLGPAFNFLLSLKDQSIYDELDLKWLQSGSIQYGLEAVAGVSKSINDNYGLFLELRYGMYNGNHLTSSRRFVAGVGYVPIQDSFDSISNSFGILGGFTFY
ncbi:outer membrane beta-barrel protein [Catalinimonas alkaloidigena]|uniref:outer membrane beta-barrel protein n=1 Tax=Catalinimonas alkaloidigena TaxID=1075417 RepID=UPI002405281C|nr:outer membrane beta-barrel protein [Catalinimonas alkaloidigena]